MEDIRPNALDIAFNVLKIRYAEYDRMIQMNGCNLQPGDRINVFINLESMHLSPLTGIETVGSMSLF